MARVPPKVREIAWKAQSRLTARFRAFAARGKKLTVACTAIARELAGFMWAVAREVQPQSKAACRRLSRRSLADLPRTGGDEATAGEFPSRAMWPTSSTPDVRQGQPRTHLGHAVTNPRIRA